MLNLHPCATPLQRSKFPLSKFYRHVSFPHVLLSTWSSVGLKSSIIVAKANRSEGAKTPKLQKEIEEDDDDDEGFPFQGKFTGGEEEKDYNRDPEFAEILGSCLDDPQKAQSRFFRE
ncbi:hypothetical protein HHK36_014264 [Tetracentron sinense]|uniref:Uncharacterized protein n=1 Tax=Tetracentron sinense TaxID=13715 RepID=A0A834Z8G6_TETSI|nr:hypothetical protein HHK36_014264 [Tetracentron sinense]